MNKKTKIYLGIGVAAVALYLVISKRKKKSFADDTKSDVASICKSKCKSSKDLLCFPKCVWTEQQRAPKFKGGFIPL